MRIFSPRLLNLSLLSLLLAAGCGGRPDAKLGPPHQPTKVTLNHSTVEIDLPPSMEMTDELSPDSWRANWRQLFKGDKWPTGLGVRVELVEQKMAKTSLEQVIKSECEVYHGEALSKREENGGHVVTCLAKENNDLRYFRSFVVNDTFLLSCDASMLGYEQIGSRDEVLAKLERICQTVRLGGSK